MNSIKGRDIIIVGLQPWDTEIGSNCKNIALEFSKFNRVLYVNSPLDRITKIKRKREPAIAKRIALLDHSEKNLELVHENLWVYYPDVVIESINWIKLNFIFDLLNRHNNVLISKSIKKALKKLNFEDYILFNDNDIFRSFYLKDLLQPSVSIYYSRDFLLGVDYWKHHGSRLEPQLMKRSDVCVANSSYLASICKQYNANSFDVGQGCEVELFVAENPLAIPEDMVNISKPIIGYVGVLEALRLDIEIIAFIADQRPDWNIVLVGPEGREFRESRLHQMSNVFFLGSKTPDQLPEYVHAFSVCINPQVLNEVTIGNYPRKVDEYLAAGKPVVATNTPAMSIFQEYCYLAENKGEYVKFIQDALERDQEDIRQKRISFASSHTWKNSVAKIYDSIHRFKHL